jgi:hypothetical protein
LRNRGEGGVASRPQDLQRQEVVRPRLRVASVPRTHVYVRHIEHPLVERLQDPSGDDLRTPNFLDPAWVNANAESFDVLHVNFGFEFYPAEQLAQVCETLQRRGKGLLFTVHDLRNPNHDDPAAHARALDIWMRYAELVTLTDWAAERISQTWGRQATVIPHPHVIELDEMNALQAARPRHWDGFRIGVHFKSMRPNMAGPEVLEALLLAAGSAEDIRVRMHVHHDVLDPAHRNHDPVLTKMALDAATKADSVLDLHIHRYCSDAELWNFLLSVDSIVLPYRFGTHSGFLEACRDLGTGVVAPSCGGYQAQGAQQIFASDERDGVDQQSVIDAVIAARDQGRPAPLTESYRRIQQARVADAYYDVLQRAVRRATVPEGSAPVEGRG